MMHLFNSKRNHGCIITQDAFYGSQNLAAFSDSEATAIVADCIIHWRERLETEVSVQQAYMITYPTGKIYIGKDSVVAGG